MDAYFVSTDAIKEALASAHALVAEIAGPDSEAREETRKDPASLIDRLHHELQDILWATRDLRDKISYIKENFVSENKAA